RPAPTPLSLHDALPICSSEMRRISSMLGAATVAICGLLSSVRVNIAPARPAADGGFLQPGGPGCVECGRLGGVLELDKLHGDLEDRKSTRLNSSHRTIS